jgi:hypothetical protein
MPSTLATPMSGHSVSLCMSFLPKKVRSSADHTLDNGIPSLIHCPLPFPHAVPYGNVPLSGAELVHGISTGTLRLSFEGWPADLHGVAMACLSFDPRRRPSMARVTSALRTLLGVDSA